MRPVAVLFNGLSAAKLGFTSVQVGAAGLASATLGAMVAGEAPADFVVLLSGVASFKVLIVATGAGVRVGSSEEFVSLLRNEPHPAASKATNAKNDICLI